MTIEDLVKAKSNVDFQAAHDAAMQQLEAIFSPADWGISIVRDPFTASNFSNLWNNELTKRIRKKLITQKKDESDYAKWLGDTHYLAVYIYWKKLFPKGYRQNTGWRILLLALPTVGSVAIGIASHYQNGMNHRKLGLASNLLRDVLVELLGNQLSHLDVPGRKVQPDDWDGSGLIPAPISQVAGVDISPELLRLKDVRTTTVKKIIPSYVSIDAVTSLDPNTSMGERILASLRAWEPVGRATAQIFPFNSLQAFDEIRQLAIEDPAAARMRVELGRKSDKKSVVRIYYGPPGTGKTLMAVKEAVTLAIGSSPSKYDEVFQKFNELHGQVAFVTFHQSLQYEDFVESIRPYVQTDDLLDRDEGTEADDEDDPGEGNGDDAQTNYIGPVEASGAESGTVLPASRLSYYHHEGPFLRMIRRALEHHDQQHVIVIDEINRGDISRILGPLISAIDPDKRVGAEFPIGFEAQYPRAPHLETRIFMPANLHILGTMNSADRNIALVDYALRRRFEFVEMAPQENLLETTQDNPSIDLKSLLASLNKRLQYLLDRDHCIGHGYFMNCVTNQDVIERFARRVLPLLSEYFYGNEAYLLLVLGDRPGGHNNVFLIQQQDTAFKRTFGRELDDALDVGYRANETQISISLDPRFWNPYRTIPGPDDENYAVAALLKVYQDANQQKSAVEVDTPGASRTAGKDSGTAT
jgi:5-methylcytosine-specific restriction protein B